VLKFLNAFKEKSAALQCRKNVRCYSRLTSTKSPSLCMTTSSASLSNLTALLPQPHDCKCNTSRILVTHRSDCKTVLTYASTTSRTLPTSSPHSLTLPAPDAGYFVELLLLYTT
jgi:hypothetical protein